MGFYYVYVDDYGNTGTNLCDEQQPVFALAAALVRADDGSWTRLERAIHGLVHRINEELKAIGKAPQKRIHAVDLYQRKEPFRNFPVERALDWFEQLLAVGYSAGVQLFLIKVNKFKLAEELAAQANKDSCESGKLCRLKEAPLYVYVFPQLLLHLQEQLQKEKAYASLIVDQQKLGLKLKGGKRISEFFEELDIYRAFRTLRILPNILEAPRYGDSRRHTMLALADFYGYAFLGHATQPERPRLKEWYELYIAPSVEVAEFQLEPEGSFLPNLLSDFAAWLYRDGSAATEDFWGQGKQFIAKYWPFLLLEAFRPRGRT